MKGGGWLVLGCGADGRQMPSILILLSLLFLSFSPSHSNSPPSNAFVLLCSALRFSAYNLASWPQTRSRYYSALGRFLIGGLGVPRRQQDF